MHEVNVKAKVASDCGQMNPGFHFDNVRAVGEQLVETCEEQRSEQNCDWLLLNLLVSLLLLGKVTNARHAASFPLLFRCFCFQIISGSRS